MIMCDFMSCITHAYWDYYIHWTTRFLFHIVYSLMIWYTNVTKCTLVVIICPFVAMPIHLQRHHNVNNSYAYNIYLNLQTHTYTQTQTNTNTHIHNIYQLNFRQKCRGKRYNSTSVYLGMMNYWIADDQSSSRNRQHTNVLLFMYFTIIPRPSSSSSSYYPLTNS